MSDDLAPSPAALPAPRKRGRPPGQKMRIAADQLRHPHFSYLRSVIELPDMPLRSHWDRYLSHEGGPDDERHFAARLRELVGLVRFAAEQRGLSARATIALAGLDHRPTLPSPAPAPVPSPALPAPPQNPDVPTLDEWIAQRCHELGIDIDFQTQADWLAEYQDEFDLNKQPAPQPVTSIPEPARRAPSPALPARADRLVALNDLARALAKPAALDDTLSSWLSPELTARLRSTAVDGKPLPLVTIDNLIAFVNLHHYRWWRHVPRLGEERAKRVVAWLTPLAEGLGRPIKEAARKPQHELALALGRVVASIDPASDKRYGMVPLDRLFVPRELSGEVGEFRGQLSNIWGVTNDLEAIFHWLNRHAGSPRTYRTYARIVERFYLWCVLARRKPLSSLDEQDFMAYRDFLIRPPADWVQERAVLRETSEWRPLRGALSASSRRMNFTVIASMLTAMIKGGYLRANAASGILPSMKLATRLAINIDRTFTERQWSMIMRHWQERYAEAGPLRAEGGDQPFAPDEDHPDQSFLRAASLRRTRLALELGATTGLRLAELATTRLKTIKRVDVDGESVWLMTVLGKGNAHREAILFDDIKAMLEQHHRDMDQAGTALDPSNPTVRVLHDPDFTSSAAPSPPLHGDLDAEDSSEINDDEADDPAAMRPLLGALRRAPPGWKLDELGLKRPDDKSPRSHDRFGAIDSTALYQSLKRFLEDCAEAARERGLVEDAETLAAGSTHWLRHFFANSAIADGVDVVALKDALGHESLATTSVYLRTERRRLVKEISKLKRRGPGS